MQKIIRNQNSMSLDTDIIYDIGSEHCCILCIQNLDEFYINKQTNRSNLRIVTPRIPQRYIKSVMNRIYKFMDKYRIIALVVNDLGLLYEIKKAGLKIDIVLGRLLVRCQDYELGYEKRLEKTTSDNIVRCWLTPSIFHAKKLELFRQYNVKGVELCPTKAVKEFIESADIEMDIYMHRNTVVGALGRACISCRQNQIAAVIPCNNCVESDRLKHKASYAKNYMLQSDQNLFPENYLVGNIVYFIINTEYFPFDKCKAIIYDKKLSELNYLIEDLN